MGVSSRIQELFTDAQRETIIPADENRKLLAALDKHLALQQVFKIKALDNIISIIESVSQREFEKAFAFYSAFESLEEIKTIFQDAHEQEEQAAKTRTDKTEKPLGDRVKY